ncbi:MAG: RluA family pseudouridine synthase [Pseudomonadota bacterium]
MAKADKKVSDSASREAGEGRGPNVDPAAPRRERAAAHTTGVRLVDVGEEAGQRLDNFLLAQLRRLPRSRIYRMVRSGEVRINGKRARPSVRLRAGDRVRIPPVSLPPEQVPPPAAAELLGVLEAAILFEDAEIIALNKPAGLAVHGGSGVRLGLIEALRQSHGPRLELIHRLDRDTSGVLLIAKTRAALRRWQALFRPETKGVTKTYYALVAGVFVGAGRRVSQPLRRDIGPQGERRVRVDRVAGKPAHTALTRVATGADCSLLRVELITGRTHQIRVHCQHIGHPLVADERYGSAFSDGLARRLGLARLGLHAAELTVNDGLRLQAPLPADLRTALSAAQLSFDRGQSAAALEDL